MYFADVYRYLINIIIILLVHMRMLTPPEGTPGFETQLLEDSLNCSQCIPTCYETTHEIEMESSPDQRSSVWTFYSYLDVAYGNLGAKKYQRDITFAWTDLLGTYNYCISIGACL